MNLERKTKRCVTRCSLLVRKSHKFQGSPRGALEPPFYNFLIHHCVSNSCTFTVNGYVGDTCHVDELLSIYRRQRHLNLNKMKRWAVPLWISTGRVSQVARRGKVTIISQLITAASPLMIVPTPGPISYLLSSLKATHHLLINPRL